MIMFGIIRKMEKNGMVYVPKICREKAGFSLKDEQVQFIVRGNKIIIMRLNDDENDEKEEN